MKYSQKAAEEALALFDLAMAAPGNREALESYLKAHPLSDEARMAICEALYIATDDLETKSKAANIYYRLLKERQQEVTA